MANFYKKSQSVDGAAARAWEGGEKNFGTRKEKSGVEVVGAKERKVDISWLVRREKKQNQSGRSMIEMLGVLAIIGVLSLGSISAYSRAMFKHQLNVFAESFNILLNNIFTLWPEVQRQNKGQTYVILNSFFANTSQLPDSISYDPRSGYLVDVFKNYLRISYKLYKTYEQYVLRYELSKDGDKISAQSHEICRTAMLVAKENVGNISAVVIKCGGDENAMGGDLKSVYPPTLKNSGIAELDSFCNGFETKQNCSLSIYIKSYD